MSYIKTLTSAVILLTMMYRNRKLDSLIGSTFWFWIALEVPHYIISHVGSSVSGLKMMRTLFLYQTSALKCTSAFSTNSSRTLSQTCLPVEEFASPAGNNPYRWLWNRANYKIKLNKAGGTQGFITDFKLMASYSNSYSTLMHFLAVGSEWQMFKLLFTRGIRKRIVGSEEV